MAKFRQIKLRKDTKNMLVLGAIVVAVGIGGYLLLSNPYVPESFTSARAQSAEIAKQIVSLTNQSLQNLDKISIYDRHYEFSKALELVQLELERAKDSYQKAIELSGGLTAMAQGTMGITPAKARNLATMAIKNELSLVEHLITYNGFLNGLLQTLEYKFSGDIRSDAVDVQVLVKNMNSEAQEINNLNKLFNEKMGEFDGMVKK